MAGKDHILKWSTTAASNTDIANIGIQGTNLVSNFDGAEREMMAEIALANVTRQVDKAAGSYTPALTDHNQFWRCTGAVTLNLTAAATLTTGWCLWVRANGGAVTIDPSGAELIDGAATLVIADGQTVLFECNGTGFATVMQGTTIGSVPAGHIFGLTVTTNASDATNDIDIAIGSAASDDTEPAKMVLSSALGKRLDAAWTVGGTPGTALGGLDTGAVGNSTYYIWLIRRPDTGVVDALFSLSSTAPTMPANYTQKRLLSDVARVGGVNGPPYSIVGLGTKLSTAQATTSGTSIDFTGLPAGVKRITLSISGLSTSGTAIPWVQIGDSGGIETTGYLGTNIVLSNAVAVAGANNTSAFGFGQGNAAYVYHGSITLTLIDPATFLWACNGAVAFSSSAAATFVMGSKATSAILDRVRLTTSNGTDTFDAGTVNILYE